MGNSGHYARAGGAVKPADEVLVRLGPGDSTELLMLTTPTAATERRLRRFCRLVIESPSALAFDEGGR